jgi:hypothetical protein
VEEHYFERIDAKIALRRLTSGEWEDVEALQTSGVTLEGKQTPGQAQGDMNMSVDVQQSQRGESAARHLAVSYGLSVNGETWTQQEVYELPDAGLVRDIAAKIYELSGANAEQQEQIKRVREESRGGADSVDEPVGVSAGE